MAKQFKNMLDGFNQLMITADVSPVHKTWMGISVIGAALERKCWLPSANHFNYPNLYVFLVGEAGIGKSTATKKLMTAVVNKVPSIMKLPCSCSEPALVDALITIGSQKKFEWAGETFQHSAGFFYSDEAANGLKEMYSGGSLIPLLTELYNAGDGPWSTDPTYAKRTIKSGLKEIFNPCISMLCCSTPQWLIGKALSREDMEGGFGSRVLLICDVTHTRTHFSWDDLTGDQKLLEAQLVDELTKISLMQGPFVPDTGWKKAWESYGKENHKKIAVQKSTIMKNFYSRKRTQAEKVSMILSASEGRSMTLTKAHFETAWKILSDLEPALKKSFGTAFNRTSGQERVPAAVLKEYVASTSMATVTRPEILGFMLQQGYDRRQANAAIDMCREIGMLKMKVTEGASSVQYDINKDAIEDEQGPPPESLE